MNNMDNKASSGDVICIVQWIIVTSIRGNDKVDHRSMIE